MGLKQELKDRNKQIAENEEKRQAVSGIRISVFAIVIVVLIVLVGLWIKQV